jgi:hypothetical protein
MPWSTDATTASSESPAVDVDERVKQGQAWTEAPIRAPAGLLSDFTWSAVLDH